MRLRGINDIKAANAYLPTYIKEHNARYPEDVHRKEHPDSETLDLILSFHADRKLTKNLELSYNNKIYQIKTNTKGYRLRHAMVTVCEDLNGNVTIIYKQKILDYSCHVRARHKPESSILSN